jgi:uncharacterized damage-inducible protein DinB
MKNHFINSFYYDVWANRRLAICIKENDAKTDRILSIFSHILSAQLVWLNRIMGHSTAPFPIWEQYKLSEIESMIEESNERWLNFINTHRYDTFEEMIRYTNSKGEVYENTLQEIIPHVLNHSTHHRGQLTLLLRDEGIAPPPNDLIIFKRI